MAITTYEEGIETSRGDRINVVTCDPVQTGFGYPGIGVPHTILQIDMADGQSLSVPLLSPVGESPDPSGEKLALLIAQSQGLIRVGTAP